MAITVNIRYTGKAGSAIKFAEEMMETGIVSDIRQRAGNLRYEYFYSAEDPDTVLLIDSWEDQAALDRHHASPIMEEIIRLREKYDLHMTVERYVVDERIPDTDRRYIKR